MFIMQLHFQRMARCRKDEAWKKPGGDKKSVNVIHDHATLTTVFSKIKFIVK